MSWQDVLGHDSLIERFRRAGSRNRLSGSFLFVGPSGIGKKKFAFALAKSLLCQTNSAAVLDACGKCPSCLLFPEHPDFYFVSKSADKSFLPLELLIGSKEHRGKEGLCFEISRTPYMGGRKIAVIDDADFLNPEGANALLKTLEEPPVDSLLILIGSSAAKQLPTIRSRCQMVRFAPLSRKNLARILEKEGIVDSLEQGLKIATHADGSLEQAAEMLDEVLESFREELNRILAGRKIDSHHLAERLNAFVEAAGKEAQPRRRRLRSVLRMVLEYERARGRKKHANAEEVPLDAVRIDRTLDALEQIDRNANLPYIIDAWAQHIGGV